MNDVIWMGPINLTGYGTAGRTYVKALDGFCNVKLIPNNAYDHFGQRVLWNILRGEGLDAHTCIMTNRLSQNLMPPKCPLIQHEPAWNFSKLAQYPGYRIGNTTFETEVVPDAWPHLIHENVDELWVCSEWNVETFRRAGVKIPIHVIPYVLDAELYHPSIEPWNVTNKRGWNFVHIASHDLRKQTFHTLIPAYYKAFGAQDDVSLALRINCGPGNYPLEKLKSEIESIKKSIGRAKYPPILIYGSMVNHIQMPHFMKAFDCVVGAHCSEGFGLPLFQAMGLGIPVVATGYSGNMEFMTKQNSYPVDHDGLCKPRDMITNSRELHWASALDIFDLKWAKPSQEKMAEAMRYVYENQSEARMKGRHAARDVHEKFSPKRVGKMMADRIDEISQKKLQTRCAQKYKTASKVSILYVPGLSQRYVKDQYCGTHIGRQILGSPYHATVHYTGNPREFTNRMKLWLKPLVGPVIDRYGWAMERADVKTITKQFKANVRRASVDENPKVRFLADTMLAVADLTLQDWNEIVEIHAKFESWLAECFYRPWAENYVVISPDFSSLAEYNGKKSWALCNLESCPINVYASGDITRFLPHDTKGIEPIFEMVCQYVGP